MEPSFQQVAPPSDRKFGLTFAVVLGAVAARAWWLDRPTVALLSIAAAAICAALAAFAPRTLAGPNRAWFRLGLLLSRVVSPVVIGAMFLVIVTPMALIMRAAGRDALRLRRRASTYWIRRDPPGPPPESFRHQF
jgi:hypothetical protein